MIKEAVVTNSPKNLPEGWRWAKLGDVCKVTSGGTPSRAIKSYWNGNIPWVKISDIPADGIVRTTEEFITLEGLNNSSAKIFPKKTILFTIFATIGKVGILDIEATTNQAISGILPQTKDVDIWYLFYCLRFMGNKLSEEVHGVTQANINQSILKRLEIPLPPLSEQKRIVAAVERALARVERVKTFLADAGRAIEKIMPAAIKKAIPTEEVPEGWRLVKLGDVILEVQPGFSCGERDPNGFVQLRMNNIGLDGRVVLDRILKVPKSETDLAKYKLLPGDILFNNTNSPDLIGKTVLFRGELENCVYSNHITRLRADAKIVLPEWITLLLVNEQRNGTFQLMCHRFVGQAGISRRDLLSLKCPLPPLSEQKRIIAHLNAVSERVEELKTLHKEATQKVERITQSILMKAFKGELTQG